MTVIWERPDRIRVAEIHPQTHAGIRQCVSIEVRHIYRIANEVFTDVVSHVLKQQEMQLVYVERMQLSGPVFYDPVLDRPLLRHDVRDLRVHIKHLRSLPIYRQVEFDGALWIIWIS